MWKQPASSNSRYRNRKKISAKTVLQHVSTCSVKLALSWVHWWTSVCDNKSSMLVCVSRVRVLMKTRRSHLLSNCDESTNVRRKRQTDSDDDNDEHLNKQLVTHALTHGTQDIEQVDWHEPTHWYLFASCYRAMICCRRVSVCLSACLSQVRLHRVSRKTTPTPETATLLFFKQFDEISKVSPQAGVPTTVGVGANRWPLTKSFAKHYKTDTQSLSVISTRSSAIAEGPRDAPCQLKPC